MGATARTVVKGPAGVATPPPRSTASADMSAENPGTAAPLLGQSGTALTEGNLRAAALNYGRSLRAPKEGAPVVAPCHHEGEWYFVRRRIAV